MNIFFTADTHFNHAHIIKYCNRPFSSVEEMNHIMIENWNKTVKPTDTIYHLGDVYFKTFDMLGKLNGKMFLVPGNHDYKIEYKLKQYLTQYFGICPLILVLSSMKLVCCHYPILNWPFKYKGWKHFHGHSHGTTPFDPSAFDVGVDCWNFTPVHYDEVVSGRI